MAAPLFYLPLVTPLSGGATVAGAKLYSYVAGTNTPTPTYQDAGLSIPHANPVVASASGTFAPIYLNPAVIYKFDLKDRDDGPVAGYPVDNYSTREDLTAEEVGGALYARTTAEQTAGITPTSYAYAPGNILRYGADPTGVSNSATAIQRAFDQYKAGGSPCYAPAGNYRVDSSITWRNANAGVFVPGPVLRGDGVGLTSFDNRVASGYLFDIDSDSGDSHASFKGLLGGEFYGFKIRQTTAPATSSGIKLRTAYNFRIEQVWIDNLTGNGIYIPCVVGDNDGSNMVLLKHVRVENCDGWGVDAAGDSGFNETSFIRMQHVFVQACGTNVVGTPTSGGMRWKGQILTMEQCAFTLNENVALYIPGQSGLAQTCDLQNTTFENNKKRGLYVTGITSFKGRNLQFYNNNAYTATNACEFDGASFTVRNVDIDGVVVRATSGNNAYTAFKISGANADLDSCLAPKNVVWDNFDYTGQTRFDGWRFPQIRQECDLAVDSATTLLFKPTGRGNKSPIRKRGGAGGVPSTSGEWVPVQIASGGLSITNAGLANTTTYNVYLYDNAGTAALELSTTARALDTASGYWIKNSDATRLHVGRATTNGSAEFVTTGTGWLNPTPVSGTQTGVLAYVWVDSTGDLRVIDSGGSLPGSDTAGTVVGTQT